MSVRPLGNFLDVPPFWLATRHAAPVGSGQATSNPYFGDHNENGLGLWDELELSGSGGQQPIGGGYPKPNTVNIPSPNHSSRNGAKIDTIILHHTAGGGTAQDVGRYFQNRSAQVSANYTIGKDGTIVQSVPDDR
ncbi:MAG: N-acetylmuramoyl-L-alanine amidase, partial [Candidatus Sericytochromatia bacterium]